VEVKKGKDGKVTVKIKGVDVYDPTTGQVRNSNTEVTHYAKPCHPEEVFYIFFGEINIDMVVNVGYILV